MTISSQPNRSSVSVSTSYVKQEKESSKGSRATNLSTALSQPSTSTCTRLLAIAGFIACIALALLGIAALVALSMYSAGSTFILASLMGTVVAKIGVASSWIASVAALVTGIAVYGILVKQCSQKEEPTVEPSPVIITKQPTQSASQNAPVLTTATPTAALKPKQSSLSGVAAPVSTPYTLQKLKPIELTRLATILNQKCFCKTRTGSTILITLTEIMDYLKQELKGKEITGFLNESAEGYVKSGTQCNKIAVTFLIKDTSTLSGIADMMQEFVGKTFKNRYPHLPPINPGDYMQSDITPTWHSQFTLGMLTLNFYSESKYSKSPGVPIYVC